MSNIILTPNIESVIFDGVRATGKLRFEHYIAAENRIAEHITNNLVVSVGKSYIASRMSSASAPVMGWMEVGTVNTAPSVGDTALLGVIAASRTALATSGGVPTGAVVRYVATFGAGVGTGAWVEAGIFNAASAGTMLCRTTFATINKASADSITVTWDVTVS